MYDLQINYVNNKRKMLTKINYTNCIYLYIKHKNDRKSKISTNDSINIGML